MGNLPKGNGWNEWKIKVLADLKSLTDTCSSIRDKQQELELKFVQMQTEIRTKAKYTGAIYGSGTTAILLTLYEVLKYNT